MITIEDYFELKQNIKQLLERCQSESNGNIYEITNLIYTKIKNNKSLYIFNNYLSFYEIIKKLCKNEKFNLSKKQYIEIKYFYWDLMFDVRIDIFIDCDDIYYLLEDKDVNRNTSITNKYKYKVKYRVLFTKGAIASDNHIYDAIYDYDEIANKIYEISKNIYFSNYNYHFLENELNFALNNKNELLIVGSSYSLNGINKNLIRSKSINLSNDSQDLYYSYKLAEKCINQNDSFTKCIIGVGYYVMNFDMSKSTKRMIDLVKDIYIPILNDSHNLKENIRNPELYNKIGLEYYINDKILKHILNLDNIMLKFSRRLYNENPNFFNINRERIYCGFDKMDKTSKIKQGEERAYAHNKLLKYTDTNLEYINIFNDFIKFLNDKKVTPIIVVFPKTDYYLEKSEFIDKFYDDINQISGYYELIDFNKINIFEDNDYRDVDHLNEAGSIKLTKYLNNLIYS